MPQRSSTPTGTACAIFDISLFFSNFGRLGLGHAFWYWAFRDLRLSFPKGTAMPKRSSRPAVPGMYRYVQFLAEAIFFRA